MIRLENLHKSYGNKKVLDNINAEFEKGKIYGLFGRNGAGKTTLFRIMSNQILNFDGSVKLDDIDIKENQDINDKILLVSKDMIPSMLHDDKVKDIFKACKELLNGWDDSTCENLVKIFNIDINKKYNKYSDGFKNLITLIIGLSSEAEVLLFDEPSTALDANHRYKFYELLLEDTEKKNRTVFISTHIIDEVERIIEDVIILDNGKFIVNENIYSFNEKSFEISGNKDLVDKFIVNKNILDQKTIMENKIVSVYDNLSKDEILNLKSNDIEVKKLGLQDIYVMITNKEDLR